MTQFDLDSLIPAEILALIEQTKDSPRSSTPVTEWEVIDSRKLTREKLVDMYNTIVHIRELEKKLKDRDSTT